MTGVKLSGTCPMCGYVGGEFLRMSHTSIMRCSNGRCGLKFASPQLDPVSLDAAYRELYYPSSAHKAAIYENTPDEILEQTFSRLARTVGPLLGKRLLDFGCGIGRLCQVAKKHGICPTGIEPDAEARKAARSLNSFDVFESVSELLKSGLLKYDLITMWDVVEHLRFPWIDLENLGPLLAPGGWLLMSTPNAESLRARVERGRWENFVNHTHFYYFSPRTLEAVLSRAGFCDALELRFPIEYPQHNMLRRMVNRILVRYRLHGQLLILGRRSTSANGRGSWNSETAGKEIHAAQ